MLISKKVYEDLKTEHNRVVAALADQIEYLRIQLGTPTPRPAINPTEQPTALVGQDMYVGEDEETLLDAYANGLIDDAEMKKAMEQVGLLNKEIEVQVNR